MRASTRILVEVPIVCFNSAFMFQVRPKQTVSMYTGDGVRLDADVYSPEIDGEFPVLLMRQPYGRSIASTVVYAHPAWYAAQGYIVVIQDVRGRGTSTGDFRLFETEIEDGFATVEWAAQLPGSNGYVGMYGFSYQGMTQLYAAIQRPTALKTICPAMVAYDLYHDWAYEGDAFCLQANLGWAIQLAAETARLKGDEAAFLKLAAAAQNLPLSGAVAADPELFKELAPDSFYHDWLHRSAQDPYWSKLSPKTHAEALKSLPMLHIGGWFDTYLRGTLNLYQAMATLSQQPQHLVIGPWAHLPWGRQVGALDFGEAAVSPIDRLQVRWFDYWLKQIDNQVLAESPVRLFEMGRNEWRLFEQFPVYAPADKINSEVNPDINLDIDLELKQLYLHTTGLTAMTDGLLALVPPKTVVPQPDRWVHDPWRPVPALGSHASAPAGPFDRSALESRSDILTYTTEPLAEGLQIVGAIGLTVFIQSDAKSWDLCAVLSDVHPNGKAYNFSQGYQRIHNSGQAELCETEIALQPTCIYLPKGHCLRLSLSAACFPAYTVNPGNGDRPEQAHKMQSQPITIALHSRSPVYSNLKIITLKNQPNGG
jgi:uncharacterized protein